LKYTFKKCKLWKRVVFYKGVIFAKTYFEGNNALFPFSHITNSVIGEGSYIQRNCNIEKTKIGKYCSIADNVRTSFGTHPTSVFVSTYPAFYYDTTSQLNYSFYKQNVPLFSYYKCVDAECKYLVEIGNDVWIGSHVLIMDGVKIGDGAVIAAGAVVTKDVAPYTIVGGIPAKVIKRRFDEAQIQFLLKYRWWDRGYDWINENQSLLTNINSFMTEFDI